MPANQMIRLAHASRIGRLAAVLVALALTGLPRVAVLAAPDEAHRCTCKAHASEHDCTCAKCAAIAEKARRAAEESLPPCHRTPRAAAPERRAPEGPCVSGTCGLPEGAHPAVTGVELFVLPDGAPRAVPPPAAALAAALPGPRHHPKPPETPPPRAADGCARATLAAGTPAP